MLYVGCGLLFVVRLRVLFSLVVTCVVCSGLCLFAVVCSLSAVLCLVFVVCCSLACVCCVLFVVACCMLFVVCRW